MAEYIEREALQKRLEMHQATNPATIGKKQFQEGYYLGLSEAEIMIAQAPKADVAEVRRGEWVFKRRYYDADECNCSECGQLMTTHAGKRMNYCPRCGAKMNGGADNDKD